MAETYQSLSHSKWKCNYHLGLYCQTAVQSLVWADQETPGCKYCVSTVGDDLEEIRAYIREQEESDEGQF